MTEVAQFRIGVEATCSDGICGTLTRVVLDPVAEAVTHLVVEPKHRSGLGRLVPVDLVDVDADQLRIRCTVEEFDRFDQAEETEFLPGGNVGYGGYGPGQALSWPYFALDAALVGGGDQTMGDGFGGGLGASSPVVYDSVPLGEVSVRRGGHVHATDGDIGRVQGLVVDRGSHHVTHVLLQEGHLWGRKEVAIPISAVSVVNDNGIGLNIAKTVVEDLPPLDIAHPDR